MVPFQSWAPDVYEGAPNSITAFLSVGSKAGGLIILMRVVLGLFNSAGRGRQSGYRSFRVGADRIAAAGQPGRHSSAQSQAHARLFEHRPYRIHSRCGPLARAATAAFGPDVIPAQPRCGQTGQVAVTVYLVSYLLATFTAFIVLAVLERRLPGLEIHHLAGLSQRSPLLAAAFALSLVSMAGVPPMSGFIAKLMVILVAWNRGLYTLLFFTIFAAVAALYYYLGPIKAMYWSEPLDETPIRVNRTISVVLIVLIFVLLLTGFWAQSMACRSPTERPLRRTQVLPNTAVAAVQH